ncbi:MULTISPECIES: terpene cyclase/mutase family protein [Bacillus]|uniref:terpene cyclase/mutase family protein n=1 Tax=Bacillus TaxID=1386 RepID=UPI0005971B88|nr:prenyltransferase/squalene oxidase repeat-containing protein [Bacillus altitudinis]MDH8710639.1 sporulenol synthase [Micromonospora sp. 1209]APP16842.1 squalene--hopene cyclase [Bacillus altitudinis]MBG9903513.1 squalene-hopene cyclase [Bacillus altitudinis]MBL7242332.1 squalene--hopene cyclase [Bacillus altitudinis]USK22660.1 squalene--hopene cyclase [Bacillus altitudinis]
MQDFKTRVNEYIDELHMQVERRQREDGAFIFCFEGPMMTNAFFIMLLKAVGDPDQQLIHQLAEAIHAKQNEDGSFSLYHDQSGHLTATVQGYCGMLASGRFQKDEPHMEKAAQYIRSKGGLKNVHFMTKWMLAVNGMHPWPYFYAPLSFLLIPTSFPLHFYHLSAYARIHFVPMMIALNKRYTSHAAFPSLAHLDENMSKNPFDWFMAREERSTDDFLMYMRSYTALDSRLDFFGYEAAKRYMFDRLEKDGTLYSYLSATIFMVYALMSLGYSPGHHLIQKAVRGMKKLVTSCQGKIYAENSTSTVWDTALVSYASQRAGRKREDPMIMNSFTYLLDRQQMKKADWAVQNRLATPGGFGFSHINTNNPDCDDTQIVLKAIPKEYAPLQWKRGYDWLLSMQNRDGGFSAFEKNQDHFLLRHLPLESAEDAAIDPSTPDITGRVLHLIGLEEKETASPTILRQKDRCVKWLIDHQEKNGSWFGRWGVCYIYGTWAALTGLKAAGIPSSHPAVQKACRFLKQIQLEDGSFGESCKSAELKTYVPLSFGTVVQTAWATEALLQYEKANNAAILKAVYFLVNHHHTEEAMYYPVGIGLPKQFYITYHSYPFVFPMMACSTFLEEMRRIHE